MPEVALVWLEALKALFAAKQWTWADWKPVKRAPVLDDFLP